MARNVLGSNELAALHFGFKRIVAAFADWLKTHDRRLDALETRLDALEKKAKGLEQLGLSLETAIEDSETTLRDAGRSL